MLVFELSWYGIQKIVPEIQSVVPKRSSRKVGSDIDATVNRLSHYRIVEHRWTHNIAFLQVHLKTDMLQRQRKA